MIPKKSLTQKIKEEELDKLGKVENVSQVERRKREEKCKRLKEDEKQKLKDFIFGKSDFNPLAGDK